MNGILPMMPGGGPSFGGIVIGLVAIVVVSVCAVRLLSGRRASWVKRSPETIGAPCDRCGADRSQFYEDEPCPSCGALTPEYRERERDAIERAYRPDPRVDPFVQCGRCGRQRGDLASDEACPECGKAPPSARVP